MAGPEQVWLPLVDEPVGDIVAQLQAEDPELERLIGSPRRILAFRTFAYIRVGIRLGELLFEQERATEDADENWVEALLKTRSITRHCTARSRAVAEEIAADPKYADEEPLWARMSDSGPLSRVRPRASSPTRFFGSSSSNPACPGRPTHLTAAAPPCPTPLLLEVFAVLGLTGRGGRDHLPPDRGERCESVEAVLDPLQNVSRASGIQTEVAVAVDPT